MRILTWIFLFLVTMLTFNTAHAARYYMAPFGLDANNGTSSATAVATSSRCAALMSDGDTCQISTGVTGLDLLYVSTGRGSGAFGSQLTNASFLSHSNGRISFVGISSATPPIAQGYGILLDLLNLSSVTFQDIVHTRGSSDRTIEGDNISYCKFIRIGSKNGSLWSSTYANIMELIHGSHHNLFEECWVIGIFRYAFIVGGNTGFDRFNIFRRCFTRFDGSNTNQPIAGFAAYGLIGGTVDGAETNLFQNNLSFDFNNSTHAPTSNVEACMYNPHGSTGTTWMANMALNSPNRGMILADSTDDGKRNHAFHNVLWNVGGDSAILLNRNNVAASSFSVRFNTIYNPTGMTYYAQGALANFSFEGNIVHRSNTGQGSDTSDSNNIYLSSSSDSGTNETNTNTDSGLTYITSSTLTGGVLGKQGASMLCQSGDDGTLWGEIGYNVTFSTKSLWPWRGQELLKTWAARPDEGDAATNMPHNAENRGFAGPTQNLTKYVWTAKGAAEPDYSLLCAGTGQAAPECSSTDLSAAISSVTNSSFTAIWTDSSATHSVAMASDVDFTNILSSGNLTGGTSGYIGLQANTQYWFKVKVATDCDYNSSVTETTLSNPAAPMTNRNTLKGAQFWKGSIFYK